MAKTKTTISMEDNMLETLKKQAQNKGMDVSSYITHLVALEEDRREQQERLERLMYKMMPNGIQDLTTLAQLIQNGGKE